MDTSNQMERPSVCVDKRVHKHLIICGERKISAGETTPISINHPIHFSFLKNIHNNKLAMLSILLLVVCCLHFLSHIISILARRLLPPRVFNKWWNKTNTRLRSVITLLLVIIAISLFTTYNLVINGECIGEMLIINLLCSLITVLYISIDNYFSPWMMSHNGASEDGDMGLINQDEAETNL